MDDFDTLKVGDLDGFEEYIRGTLKDVKEPKAPREVIFEDMVDPKEIEEFLFGDSDDIEDISDTSEEDFDANDFFI